jgi:hypothetical protein
MSEHVSIEAAICAVMSEVKRLEKAHDNTFARYKFTSVDDFKDAIRPLLAKNGLAVHMTETNIDMARETVSEKGKSTILAVFTFEMTLSHQDGANGVVERISVALPYTGAQTTGAARSYAMKEWFKTRFLASSGDVSPEEEADYREPQSHLPKKDARPIFDGLLASLRAAIDISKRAGNNDELMTWASRNRAKIEALPPEWKILLRTDWAEANDEIKLGLTSPAESTSAAKAAGDGKQGTASTSAAPDMIEQIIGPSINDLITRLKAGDDTARREIWEREIAPAWERNVIDPEDYAILKELAGADL